MTYEYGWPENVCRRAGHGGVPPGLREDLPEEGAGAEPEGGAGITGRRQKGRASSAPAWGRDCLPTNSSGLISGCDFIFHVLPFGNNDE